MIFFFSVFFVSQKSMQSNSYALKAKINKKISDRLFWLSLAVYFSSFVFPAYKTDMQSVGAKPIDHFGLEAFLLGPIGFFAGHFSWLANPFLWISWTKRDVSSSGGAAIWAVVSLLVAISFFLPKTIAVGSSGGYSYQPAVGSICG